MRHLLLTGLVVLGALLPTPARAQLEGGNRAATKFAVAADQPREKANPPKRRVSLDLRDTPFREAIGQIFAGTELKYTIEPGVPSVPVTINVRDLSISAALRLLVRLAASQAPGLVYLQKGGVHVIAMRLKPDGSPVKPPPQPLNCFFLGPTVKQWEKLPLRYLSVLKALPEIWDVLLPSRTKRAEPRLALLSPTEGFRGMWPEGLQGIVALRRENSLLAVGTPESIQELKNILRLIDVPRRRFHLRLSTRALRAEGQASEFVPFKLSDAAEDRQIEATLTPRLLGDGNVEVQVSVKLTVGSVSRRLETSVIARPGKTVTVGTLGVGKRRVVIRLNAKTFEPKPAWLPVKKNR